MTERHTLITADQFFQLYRHKDEHFELVKGEVLELAMHGAVHGAISANIASVLGSFVHRTSLGRVVAGTGFRLESQPDTVRGPDVAFVTKERMPEEGLPRAFFIGAPDLAVEIVSPSDTAAELKSRVSDYLRNGTRRVWVVHPDSRSVVVYLAEGTWRMYSEDDTVEDEELLPGFSLPVPEIFGP